MAMVSCPECKEQVSSQASKCPKCGFQISRPRRSFVGKLFKWVFILYNIFMGIWLLHGINVTTQIKTVATSAGRTGAAIGAGLGMTMILVLWVISDIILGLPVLFTRPKN